MIADLLAIAVLVVGGLVNLVCYWMVSRHADRLLETAKRANADLHHRLLANQDPFGVRRSPLLIMKLLFTTDVSAFGPACVAEQRRAARALMVMYMVLALMATCELIILLTLGHPRS